MASIKNGVQDVLRSEQQNGCVMCSHIEIELMALYVRA